jgi:hypothetical protein
MWGRGFAPSRRGKATPPHNFTRLIYNPQFPPQERAP